MIEEKTKTSQNLKNILTSTYIVRLRETSEQINNFICQNLPFDDQSSDPILSQALDTINDTSQDIQPSFKHHTNLSESVTIQEGARVMYLNNKLIDHDICNGTIGIITKTINADNIEVTFPTNSNIIKLNIERLKNLHKLQHKRHTRLKISIPIAKRIRLNGTQTQGITLSHSTVNIDEHMFASGQAYVAMSRAPSWNQLKMS